MNDRSGTGAEPNDPQVRYRESRERPVVVAPLHAGKNPFGVADLDAATRAPLARNVYG